MEISKQQLNRKNVNISLADALLNSSVDEINIYNQAFLHLDRPLIQSTVNHEKTKHELPIAFKLDGDISGSILCLLDTYNKNIPENEAQLFKSLYVESMNILLGQFFTNLDNKYSMSGIISNPTIPNDSIIQSLHSKSFSVESFSMGYKLISNSLEFDCRIIFNLNKVRSFEV